MTCANHPQTESVAYCGHCGRPLCAECKREVSGMIYCESCLANRLKSTVLPPIGGLGNGPNPGLALFLGFIPGVGSIYNGQIVKAIVQVGIFGALWALADRINGPFGVIFGLGTAAFYFYMVIDSYQTARRKQLGLPSEEWLGLGEFKVNAPVGAALLLGLGVLLLLNITFDIPIFDSIERFWPVVLIVIGLILLQSHLRRGGSRPGGGPSNPSGAPPRGPQGL
jgi:hypothetical protein